MPQREQLLCRTQRPRRREQKRTPRRRSYGKALCDSAFDAARQRPIRAAATAALGLEAWAESTVLARLQSLPGVGPWTAAETVQRAFGHPDAVSVGDYHRPDLVVYALTGRARGDDAEMLSLLQRWAGQRQRVVRLIELSGVRPPRFGPRYAPLDLRAM